MHQNELQKMRSQFKDIAQSCDGRPPASPDSQQPSLAETVWSTTNRDFYNAKLPQDQTLYRKNYKKKTPFTQWSNAYFHNGVFFNPPVSGIWLKWILIGNVRLNLWFRSRQNYNYIKVNKSILVIAIYFIIHKSITISSSSSSSAFAFAGAPAAIFLFISYICCILGSISAHLCEQNQVPRANAPSDFANDFLHVSNEQYIVLALL